MSTTTRTPSSRARTALRWGPLGLATLLVCGGGLALLSAGAGVDDDRAQVAALVSAREDDAVAAEQEFADTWTSVHDAVSPVPAEREAADSEAGAWLLAMLSEGQDSASALSTEHGVDEMSATLLIAAFTGHGGSLESFTAVGTTPEDAIAVDEALSYSAAFTVGTDAGLLTYTTDEDSRITAATVTWSDGAPERS